MLQPTLQSWRSPWDHSQQFILLATPFELRPIATELGLCQRYFEKLSIIANLRFVSTYNGFDHTYTNINFVSSKRTIGTLDFSDCIWVQVSQPNSVYINYSSKPATSVITNLNSGHIILVATGAAKPFSTEGILYGTSIWNAEL